MTEETITAEQVAEHLTYSDSVEIAQAYLDLGITASEDPAEIASEIEEAYQGQYFNDQNFAEQLLEDLGDVPKDFPAYIHIDWEGTARDIMMDYSEEGGHYFRNI